MFRGLSFFHVGLRMHSWHCSKVTLRVRLFTTRSALILQCGGQNVASLDRRSVRSARKLDSTQITSPDGGLCRRYSTLQVLSSTGNNSNFQRLFTGYSGHCISLSRSPVSCGLNAPHSLARKSSVRHCSTEAAAWYFDFPPVVFMQNVMEGIHSYLHLPWWATILVMTLMLRTVCTLPLSMYIGKIAAKVTLLEPTISMMKESMQHNVKVRCKRAGKSFEETELAIRKEYSLMVSKLYKEEGIQVWRIWLLPYIQVPLFWSVSLALRKMSFFPNATGLENVLCPEMATEGILWFSNLTVADPYYILPVLLGIINFANLQIHSLAKVELNKWMRLLYSFLKYTNIFMVFIATQLPAAMSLYWTLSASYGLAQSILIKYPFVRRKLGIPETPTESNTPIADLGKNMQRRAEIFLAIQKFEEMKRKDKKDR